MVQAAGKAVDEMARRVLVLLRDRLKVRAKTLEDGLRQARRDLPPAVRAAGAELVEAQRLAGHPKLAMMLDMQSLEAAQDVCVSHLSSIGMGRRAGNMLLLLLGRLALVVLICGGVALWVLSATGGR